MPNAGRRQFSDRRMMPAQTLLKCKTLQMNSDNKILLSRRASSSKTPETASAAKHGLRKRLTVLLLIQGRSNNFFSSP